MSKYECEYDENVELSTMMHIYCENPLSATNFTESNTTLTLHSSPSLLLSLPSLYQKTF